MFKSLAFCSDATKIRPISFQSRCSVAFLQSLLPALPFPAALCRTSERNAGIRVPGTIISMK